MNSNRLLSAVLLSLLVGLPLSAQQAGSPAADETDTAAQQDQNDQPEDRERRRLEHLGLIFNTPDVLLQLDEYQGAGIGMKGFSDNLALRGLLGLTFNTNNDVFGLTLGSALEFHPARRLVSPYFGGELLLDYYRDDVGPSTVRTFGVSLGPLFGVEIAPFEIVSVFAEYTLAFSAVYSETSGAMGEDQRWNYSIATGLGNRGSIGIIVYFLDRRRADDAGTPGS